MSNEIWHSYAEEDTLYALIWRKVDDYIWDNTGSAFVTPHTDANIDRYDVLLTNHADSDYHSVDFPSAIASGVYRVQIMLIVGVGMDADVDLAVAQGEIAWDGSAEINVFTEQESWLKNG